MKTVAFSILFFLWGGANCAYGVALSDFEGMRIEKIQAMDLSTEDMQDLKKRLSLELGKTLDRRKLDEGLKAAHSSGEWRRLRVEVSPGSSGAGILRLAGNRVRRLHELKFKGLSEEVLQEVKQIASERQDNSADPRAFSFITEAIRDSLDERGFVKPEISVEVIPVNAQEADVEISVELGEPQRVDSVKVTGGSEVENKILQEQVTLRRGEIFSRRKLNVSIDRINNYLRDNQYSTSKVTDTHVVADDSGQKVKVEIKVSMGQRLLFLFSGNTVFSDVQLRELITPEVLSLSDPTPKIVELIIDKYKSVGYHFCKAEPVLQEDTTDGPRTLEIKIDEQKKVRIDDVILSGGEAIRGINVKNLFYEVSPGVLKRKVFWEKGLPAGIESLKKSLREKGYLNARLSDPKVVFNSTKDGVVLYLDFDLGEKTFISEVEVLGNAVFRREELLAQLSLQKGDPLNELSIEKGRENILALYANKGYTEARFGEQTGTVFSSDGQHAKIVYAITEGPHFTVGSVSISGLKKTQGKVVYREMLLHTGDSYSPVLIAQSEEAIQSLGLFQRVQIVSQPTPDKPTEMNLVIVVSESRPGLGEVGVGAMYEEPRLRTRAFANLQYQNLSGLNQTVSTRGVFSIPFSTRQQFIPFLEYSGNIGYRMPYPFDIPVTFSSQLGVDRFETTPDFQTLVNLARIEGKVEKKLTKSVTVYYRLLRLERSVTESLLPGAPTSGNPTTASIGSTGPGIILDFRDDVFNPNKGSYHSVDTEFALPQTLSQSDIGFLMVLNRNSFYFPFLNPIGLKASVGFGYAQSLLSDKALPQVRLVNELAIGGQGTVRGHIPRSIAAPQTSRSVFFYNVRGEVLFPLFEEFGVATFYDMGQLYPDHRATPLTHGVGVGFRYKTPVGPISVDLAQGFGYFGESTDKSVRFYFTVGTI